MSNNGAKQAQLQPEKKPEKKMNLLRLYFFMAPPLYRGEHFYHSCSF